MDAINQSMKVTQAQGQVQGQLQDCLILILMDGFNSKAKAHILITLIKYSVHLWATLEVETMEYLYYPPMPMELELQEETLK